MKASTRRRLWREARALARRGKRPPVHGWRTVGRFLLDMLFLLVFSVVRGVTYARHSRVIRVSKRAPLRSTKADAKRRAHEFVEHTTGRQMGWKGARKQMAKWNRDARRKTSASAAS